MTPLQGDPYNLQGSAPSIQGGAGAAALQPASSPIGPQPFVGPTTPATAPRPAQAVSKPATDFSYLISPSLSSYLGARPSPANPTVAEFYRKDSNQALTPEQLFGYASSLGLGQITSFDQIKTFAPRVASAAPVSSTPIPSTATPGAPTDPNQTLAQKAAAAGLSLDDYLKVVTPGISPEEKSKIYGNLGIPELERNVFTPPSKTTEQLFNDAYSSAGLADIKTKIQEKLDEINTAKQGLTDEQGNVNENPFLSEASRVGRISRLNDKAEAHIGNLTDELSQLTDLYNNGVGEVNSLVSRQTADFSANQSLNTEKLQYLLQKAETQISDLQANKTSQAYNYLPDYLNAKAKSTKPDVIGSGDSGYYRWNPDTGTFEQVIAPQNDLNQILSPTDALALGVPYGTTRGQALQLGIVPQRPATDTQNQAAGYAVRVKQSGDILNNLESAIQNYNPIGFEAEIRLPSYAQSSQIQSYNQAAQNFVNAVLRRESGAAISQSEFDNAYKQYLPRPGDSAQVLDQKKANRDAVYNSLVNSSGPAYQSSTGSDANSDDPLGLFSSVGNTSASKGMRTDRNNNPTAFTSDVAKAAGLILGKDYTIGDAFPNNPNLHTARLLGDPIATTIKVIDRIGFYTDSGKPRWSYVNSIPQAQNWNNLSYSQRVNVIKQMYAYEGGTALLNNFA